MRNDTFQWFTMRGCKGPEVESCLVFLETARRIVHLECMRWGKYQRMSLETLGEGEVDTVGVHLGHCKDFSFYFKGNRVPLLLLSQEETCYDLDLKASFWLECGELAIRD